MKSPLQRRVAIASLLMAPALGACGFTVQTEQVYQAAVGSDNRDSTVDVLNAVIVTNGTGQGTFAGSLVNNTDTADAVESVSAGAGVEVVPGGDLVVPAYGLVNMSRALEGGEIPLVLDGEPVEAGRYLTLTFTFRTADPVTLQVPVVDNTGEGEDYEQVPLPPATGEIATDEPAEGDSEDEGAEN